MRMTTSLNERMEGEGGDLSNNYYTVICLIEAPGAGIPWSTSCGSELSNAGFGLKIGQLLREIRLF